MVFEYQNYRSFLRLALTERAKHGAGYSLRGFAGKIRVSNSFLSEVLNSKKSLSVELAFKIAVKLELTDAETQYFCLLVQLEHEKDPQFREELIKRLKSLNPRRAAHDLTIDLFKTIAEWHHAAILELTYLPGFNLNPERIAKKIAIPKVEAELALERLERLELLTKDDNGRYRKSHGLMHVESQVSDPAFKKYHGQILEKAAAALQSQTPAERLSTTSVLAIDAKYVKQVDRLMTELSSAVLGYAQKSTVHNSVYALCIHFFRLTTK